MGKEYVYAILGRRSIDGLSLAKLNGVDLTRTKMLNIGYAHATFGQLFMTVLIDYAAKITDPWIKLTDVVMPVSVIANVSRIEPHGPVAAVFAANDTYVCEFTPGHIGHKTDCPILVCHGRSLRIVAVVGGRSAQTSRHCLRANK